MTKDSIQDQDSAQNEVPKTARAMSLILSSMGVEDADPKVVHQLLDLTFRTTTDIIELAMIYADHRGENSEINVDDVRLAIQNINQSEFTGPPPRELMAELATQKNREPLPLISEKFGLRLPPDMYCLTQPSYKVVGMKVSQISKDTDRSALINAIQDAAEVEELKKLEKEAGNEQFESIKSDEKLSLSEPSVGTVPQNAKQSSGGMEVDNEYDV